MHPRRVLSPTGKKPIGEGTRTTISGADEFVKRPLCPGRPGLHHCSALTAVNSKAGHHRQSVQTHPAWRRSKITVSSKLVPRGYAGFGPATNQRIPAGGDSTLGTFRRHTDPGCERGLSPPAPRLGAGVMPIADVPTLRRLNAQVSSEGWLEGPGWQSLSISADLVMPPSQVMP